MLIHSGGEAAQHPLGSGMDPEHDPALFKIPTLLHQWRGRISPEG
jgi:hypothetical protein